MCTVAAVDIVLSNAKLYFICVLKPLVSATLPLLPSRSTRFVYFFFDCRQSFVIDSALCCDQNVATIAKRRDEVLNKFTDLDFTVRQISASLLIDAQLRSALASLAASMPSSVSPATNALPRRRRTSSTAPPMTMSTDYDIATAAMAATSIAESKPEVIEPLVASAATNANATAPASFPLALLRSVPVQAIMMLLWTIGSALMTIITAPIPMMPWLARTEKKQRTTLVEVSNFAQQLHRRLEEISQWPALYDRLQQHRKYDETEAACYMRLWGSMTRVVIDALLGCLVIWWLVASASGASWLRSMLHYAGQLLHLDVLQARTRWLMQQPAGAKLNQNLSVALGQAVLYMLDGWNALTTFDFFDCVLIIFFIDGFYSD
jgi:hypothetical protein